MRRRWVDHLSVGRGFSRITHMTPNGLEWWQGVVATRHGFVAVYSQHDFSRFDFVHGGQLHILYERRHFTERGLATKAKRFAASIVEE